MLERRHQWNNPLPLFKNLDNNMLDRLNPRVTQPHLPKTNPSIHAYVSESVNTRHFAFPLPPLPPRSPSRPQSPPPPTS